jgi:PKD repeat protein
MTANPTSGPAPLTVTFDATASVDSDGTIINYFWDFGDGNTANGSTASHTYAPGNYTAQLVVTDNLGGFSTDAEPISATNLPPVAAFTVTSSTGTAPLAITANAATSNDPDGSITSYAWDFDTAGSFPGDTASGVTANHTYGAGVYTARLTVTDNNGVTATTTRTITVSGTPAAPTGLHLTGSGCCDTYGDFAWNQVPGADAYNVEIDGYFLGGCVTDHGATFNGQVSTGRVQAVGLCLGSNYDASIRARANGTWGPFSSSINFNL